MHTDIGYVNLSNTNNLHSLMVSNNNNNNNNNSCPIIPFRITNPDLL